MSLTIVTGAGSGMGRAIALSLVASGQPVLLIGRREEALKGTASLSSRPELVSTATGDLGDVAQVEVITRKLNAVPIRGIIATAGGQGSFINPGQTVAEINQAWEDALRKNLLSAVLLIEALLNQIEDEGRIVLIGSTAGLDGQGGAYSVAKAALHGYARDLARRLGARRITSNAVAPGFVAETEFFEAGGLGDSSGMIDWAAGQTLLGRVGRPENIVGCVDWLMSDSADWVTGQTISVNGGSVLN